MSLAHKSFWLDDFGPSDKKSGHPGFKWYPRRLFKGKTHTQGKLMQKGHLKTIVHKEEINDRLQAVLLHCSHLLIFCILLRYNLSPLWFHKYCLYFVIYVVAIQRIGHFKKKVAKCNCIQDMPHNNCIKLYCQMYWCSTGCFGSLVFTFALYFFFFFLSCYFLLCL